MMLLTLKRAGNEEGTARGFDCCLHGEDMLRAGAEPVNGPTPTAIGGR